MTRESWAARMVEHHSTALTTSERLLRNGWCDDASSVNADADALCTVARAILRTQAVEIETWKTAAPVATTTTWTAIAVLATAVPAAAYALWVAGHTHH